MTETRPCTCAPDERPYPCQHQYALGLCRKQFIRSLIAERNILQADLAAALLLLQEAYNAMREPTSEWHDIKCNTVLPKIHYFLAKAPDKRIDAVLSGEQT